MAFSSGNFGQGLSAACGTVGVRRVSPCLLSCLQAERRHHSHCCRCTIVMPGDAPLLKEQRCRSYGAEVPCSALVCTSPSVRFLLKPCSRWAPAWLHCSLGRCCTGSLRRRSCALRLCQGKTERYPSILRTHKPMPTMRLLVHPPRCPQVSAAALAAKISREEGMTLVHPFEDFEALWLPGCV